MPGVLGDGGEQGVGCAGAAGGGGDVEVVEVAADCGCGGAGKGADVGDPDDGPAGVVSDQPFELVGRADQPGSGALGLLVGLGEPVEGGVAGVQLPPAVVVAGLERTHEPAAERLCCITVRRRDAGRLTVHGHA